ncbi:MAG: URC4/urg3 family protein [Synechococcales cyanobacterium C42_A2020_086]|jgi:hypothetical protein|nr:URC4/urg3 family protein [Synechococcales cyanobacterium C42_A2020_086]
MNRDIHALPVSWEQALSPAEQQAVCYLRSTPAIRERCGQLFALALQDELPHFCCNLAQLDAAAEYVLQVMRRSYPDLQIPFHSRWRHFQVGGIDRLAQLRQQLADQSLLEQVRAQFDLAVTSVLLDAGAGTVWQYVEPGTQQVFRRSEGLAVASVRFFQQGGFSSDPSRPLQADAAGLQALSLARLSEGFQVSRENPLVGMEGRLSLMQRLGQALQAAPHLFGKTNPRPGFLVDYLLQQAEDHQLSAATVLQAVLTGFSSIWPGRETIAGVNLGDVWRHPSLPDQGIGTQLVPFHKLSQWLTYSLLEPLQTLGLHMTGLDDLTGLAEYRNGGLFLDLGVIQPKQASVLSEPHSPGSTAIVEWRALTVVLLDQLADRLRQMLNRDAASLPLVAVLEGGTWAAGRQIAAERRPNGEPPLTLLSDGTVF